MSLLNRIKELRELHGNISINRLEKETGLTRGSMAKWDDHAPSYDKLKKVADYFGVSVSVLTEENEEKPISVPEDGLSKDETKLLTLFRQVPEESQQMVTGMIEAALKNLGLLE